MSEAHEEQDELLLMRHLEGRLSATDTAALKARLAAEPALAEQLEALELENDLIVGAVSVPADVELAEPVMMAIIDQAMKDPKRAAAGRSWWKPVTLSVGAAAAVVLAVLTSFLLTADKTPALKLADVRPDGNAAEVRQPEKGTGAAAVTTLLGRGAEIRVGSTINGTGGRASLSFQQGIGLHFDADTQVGVQAIELGQTVVFELLSGALMVDFQPTAEGGAFQTVQVVSPDGKLQVTLDRGRALIQPLSGATASGECAPYLVYLPEGQGRVAPGTVYGHNAVSLSDGSLFRGPDGERLIRNVARQPLVRDLLCGWQFTPTHSAGAWWTGELRYDNLDRAWPVEWAREINADMKWPSFLTQAEGLTDSMLAGPQAGDAVDNFHRWMDMSNTLDDRLLRSQLTSASELAWNLLTVKANRMALAIAAAAPVGRLSPTAAEAARERLATALRWLETKAMQNPTDTGAQAALNWLRIECDFLNLKSDRNEAARWQQFAQQFPTSIESLSAQLKSALLETSGDPRLSRLNVAWQDAHQFAVRMRDKLAVAERADERERLLQIQIEILTALAQELYARRQYAEGDTLARLPAFLNLTEAPNAHREAQLKRLQDLPLIGAADQAGRALEAGDLKQAETVLRSNQPEAFARLSQPLRENADVPNLNLMQAHTAGHRRWAETWHRLLLAKGDSEGAKQFAQWVQQLVILSEPTPTPAEPAGKAVEAPAAVERLGTPAP